MSTISPIDARHFLVNLYEVAGFMVHDRPRDNDATYLWSIFLSCVRVLDVLDMVDGKVLKLVLSINAPTGNDNDIPSKYVEKVYEISSQMLDIIGWPDSWSDSDDNRK